MTATEIAPWLTFAGVIAAGLIALLTKRTPEKTDPAKAMQDTMTHLAERVKTLEGSTADQWIVIQELRSKVDSLYMRLRRLVAYTLDLEEALSDRTGQPPERPDGIEDIINNK